jgi:hypothetical protein
MQSLRTSVFLLLCLFLGACGGGGSSSTPVGVVTTADATGVWQGTITENGVGTFDVVGLIYEDDLRFISVDSGVVYEGTISITGTNFTATTTNIDIVNGGVISTSTLAGTVITASSITGTYTSSDGSSGSFSLTYDPITTRGASLATIEGNWSVTDGTFTITLSIDANGLLTGSDTDFCVYNGTVSVLDPAVNIYGISLTASSCGAFDGAYEGYGVVGDTLVADDTLTFVVTNANSILVGELDRQ